MVSELNVHIRDGVADRENAQLLKFTEREKEKRKKKKLEIMTVEATSVFKHASHLNNFNIFTIKKKKTKKSVWIYMVYICRHSSNSSA